MISLTTVVSARYFELPGFDEQLPAGDYDIETELSAPPDHRDAAQWKASVMVALHSRASHPGLARNLTVSLADLDGALARDKLSGNDLATFLLDELLEDPMVRLLKDADGVSEVHLRALYADSGGAQLPGAGWIAFDPTDRSIGSGNLIPVAVTRDVHQVVPVTGSFAGSADTRLNFTVRVQVGPERLP